jgi:uncharacterized membrane protein YbhN (UPF0104 family)
VVDSADEASTREFTQPKRRRWGRAVAGTAFVLLAAIFLVLALRNQREEIGHSLEHMSLGAAALAEIALLVGLLFSLFSWQTILASLGHPLRLRESARVFFVGQLGKYVPGSVWPVVVQMEMGRAHDVPRTQMFSATAVATVIGLVAGAVVGVSAVPALVSNGGTSYLLALLAIPVGLMVLHPRVLNALLRLGTRLLRREPPTDQFRIGTLSRAFGFSLVTWLCFGIHILVLAHSTGHTSMAKLVPLSIGGFAIAWVAGFLFILSPAGVGVREAVLIVTLGPTLGSGSATAVALVSRLLGTLADGVVALVALVSYLALRRTRRISNDAVRRT